MDLTSTEKMLLELLQEKDVQAQRESQQRMMRFLTSVSERTGIPVDVLGINSQTGAVTDARIASDDRTTADAVIADEPA